jgi:hypothetical protein
LSKYCTLQNLHRITNLHAKKIIYGWISNILATSSKTRWVFYLKFLFQPNRTKNKEVGAKNQKPYNFDQHYRMSTKFVNAVQPSLNFLPSD